MSNVSDEKLVERFLMQGRIEVPDGGFSHRIIRHLPSRITRLNRIWTVFCVTAGIATLVISDAFNWLSGTLRGMLADVSTHEAVFSAPVITALFSAVAVSMLSATIILKDLR